jgi:hypothetical protein
MLQEPKNASVLRHEVTFDELGASILANGPNDGSATWDAVCRLRLIDNLEILSRQLWQVGVHEIFADGSFAEDKDHPNDIDGYFECSLDAIRTGELTREPNRIDPFKIWTWPSDAAAVPWLSKETATDVASVPGGTVSTYSRTQAWQRHSRQVRPRVGVSFRLPAIAPRWQATRHRENQVWRTSMIRNERNTKKRPHAWRKSARVLPNIEPD